jgi:hypothetical protein
MLIERYATPQEEAATAAWHDYDHALGRAHAALGDDRFTSTDRRRLSEQAIEAHARWADAYRLLTEPTPEPLQVESGRLHAEGMALLAVAGWAFLLLVPAVFEWRSWTVLAAIAAFATLAGWAGNYLGRLGQHFGRRL